MSDLKGIPQKVEIPQRVTVLEPNAFAHRLVSQPVEWFGEATNPLASRAYKRGVGLMVTVIN